MDDEVKGALRAAETAAGVRGNGLAAMLAERVGNRAGVQAIFGEPVERDGVTVIPVGRIRWGFGGGGGRGGPTGGPGEGSGGGGGPNASPAGYIEISGGTARFRRIGFPLTPGTLVAGAIGVMLMLRGLRGLVR